MPKTRNDIDRMQREEHKDHERAFDRKDKRLAKSVRRDKLSDGEKRPSLRAAREGKRT